MSQSHSPAIETHGLSRDYGAGRGLFDLDLVVEPGEGFGYLGPNGAGKSTTIRLLMGLIHPTSGSARVFGVDVAAHPVKVRKMVGYLPGELPQFGAMRGGQVLSLLAGLRRGGSKKYASSLANRLDLDLSRHYRDYSRGNKQKLGLVAALMPQPRLLILDEPTAGLDPLVQQEFYRIVHEARRAETTVFMSSHVFAEVEHTCSRVGIIRDGRLVQQGGLSEIHSMRVHRVSINFDGHLEAGDLERAEGVSQVRLQDHHLECHVQGSFDALLKVIQGVRVTNLISQEPSLEEVFLTYYSKDAAWAAPETETAAGTRPAGTGDQSPKLDPEPAPPAEPAILPDKPPAGRAKPSPQAPRGWGPRPSEPGPDQDRSAGEE